MAKQESKSPKQEESPKSRGTSSKRVSEKRPTKTAISGNADFEKREYKCFLICPLGKVGSRERNNADLLEDFIMDAAKGIGSNEFKITVDRGDKIPGTGFSIQEKVDKLIREADFCVIDISEPNVNVFYEYGIRQGITRGPRPDIILLKRKGAKKSPVDVRGCEYVEYKFNTFDKKENGIKDLEKAIKFFIKSSFTVAEEDNIKASLQRLEDMLVQVRDKLVPPPPGGGNTNSKGFDEPGPSETRRGSDIPSGDTNGRLDSGANSEGAGEQSSSAPSRSEKAASRLSSAGEENDKFRLAIRQRDIPSAEAAMYALERTMPRLKFYDRIVEQVAGLGSDRAGQMLIDCAQEFMSSKEMPPKKKLEYLSFLVTYCNRSDRELECMQMLESFAAALLREKDLRKEVRASVHNQLNRLYSGAAMTVKLNDGQLAEAKKYRNMAIKQIKLALKFDQTDFLYANLASDYNALAELTDNKESQNRYLEQAKTAIDKCMVLMRSPDADYLYLACKIYKKLDDPGYTARFERLERIDPTKAALLSAEYDE